MSSTPGPVMLAGLESPGAREHAARGGLRAPKLPAAGAVGGESGKGSDCPLSNVLCGRRPGRTVRVLLSDSNCCGN